MFNNSTDSFLLDLIKNKPRYIIISCIFSLASAVFGAVSIVLLIPLLFALSNNEVSVASNNFSYFVSFFITLSNFNANYKFAILIALVFTGFVISIIGSYLSYFFSS